MVYSEIMTPGLKIIFFVTEDWYFCSHRLPLALAAQQTGYDVPVITRVKQHGLKLIPIKLSHRSQNPLKELDVIRQLLRIYREQRPGIVHHVALKTDKLRKQLSRPPPRSDRTSEGGISFATGKPAPRTA